MVPAYAQLVLLLPLNGIKGCDAAVNCQTVSNTNRSMGHGPCSRKATEGTRRTVG